MEMTEGYHGYSGGDSQVLPFSVTFSSLGYPLSVFNKNSTLKAIMGCVGFVKTL